MLLGRTSTFRAALEPCNKSLRTYVWEFDSYDYDLTPIAVVYYKNGS